MKAITVRPRDHRVVLVDLDEAGEPASIEVLLRGNSTGIKNLIAVRG